MDLFDPQTWTEVTIRGKSKGKTVKHPAQSHEGKLLRSLDTDEPRTVIKCLSSSSRQLIIQKRIELGWNQAKLNTMCAFTLNTIRDMETGHLIPTPKQLSVLNRVLKLALSYE